MDRQEVSFSIGKRLMDLRNSKNLSRQKLADALSERYNIKISEDSLRDYEIDNENASKSSKLPNLGMRLEYLYCLADFYGVSMDYITGRSAIKATDEDIKALVAKTGLSEKCIENLKIIHDTDIAARADGKVKYETIETINCLVEGLSEKSDVLVWIGRYLSVPELTGKRHYISVDGEIKERSTNTRDADNFCDLNRGIIESALLQQVNAELMFLKMKLNSDEFQGDLEKWKEENK